jgi:ABC-type branched-subunit amino acid transport system ATPase component/ABC-type branched-subunit amino acid transport system permease subunit
VRRWAARIRPWIGLRTVADGEVAGLGSPRSLVLVTLLSAGCAAAAWSGGTYADLLVAVGASYAVTALGYNVILGYAGQMVFSQAGFMAVGAYTFAVLADLGAPLAVALVAACVGCAGLGALVCGAVVRTRDLYLALVTFAFAQAAVVVITRIPRSGGYDGIGVPSPPGPDWWWSVALAAVAIVALTRVVRSAIGRRLLMVRDDEVAAAAVGVPVVRTKVLAFVISAMFGGLGGAMLAMALGYISPENFTLHVAIFVLTIVVVGGQASIWGVLIAAGLFVWLNDRLTAAGEIRDFVYGGVLLAALAALPMGIASVPRLFVRRWSRQPPVPAADRGERGRPRPVATRDQAATAPTGDPPSGGAPPALVGEDVSVRFDGVVAVDHVSFAIPPGSIVGLIGPNGAGKSTLLNAISGLVPATGSIRVEGTPTRELIGLPAHARPALGIGRTFQHSRLFGSMSVIEQLVAGALARQRYGLGAALVRTPAMIRDEAETLDHARELIAEFGLGGREYDSVDELPGPHRRLVDVGRALMSKPRLLLLDEVGAGLSGVEKQALCDSLEALASRRTLTMVIVEHDLDFIRSLAGRTIVLDQGRVVVEAETEDALAHHEVVAAYIGERQA